MQSMKMTQAEAKTMLSECCPSDPAETPAYPYGLTLSLCEESLAKLGMTELPEVGTKMNLKAVCVVISASQRATQGGTDSDVSLQITDMELAEDPATEEDDTAGGMYPTMKK